MSLSHERFISCFQGDRKESQNVPLVLAISYVTLIQNNQDAIVAYLGIICLEPQYHMIPNGSYLRALLPPRQAYTSVDGRNFVLLELKSISDHSEETEYYFLKGLPDNCVINTYSSAFHFSLPLKHNLQTIKMHPLTL